MGEERVRREEKAPVIDRLVADLAFELSRRAAGDAPALPDVEENSEINRRRRALWKASHAEGMDEFMQDDTLGQPEPDTPAS